MKNKIVAQKRSPGTLSQSVRDMADDIRKHLNANEGCDILNELKHVYLPDKTKLASMLLSLSGKSFHETMDDVLFLLSQKPEDILFLISALRAPSDDRLQIYTRNFSRLADKVKGVIKHIQGGNSVLNIKDHGHLFKVMVDAVKNEKMRVSQSNKNIDSGEEITKACKTFFRFFEKVDLESIMKVKDIDNESLIISWGIDPVEFLSFLAGVKKIS